MIFESFNVSLNGVSCQRKAKYSVESEKTFPPDLCPGVKEKKDRFQAIFHKEYFFLGIDLPIIYVSKICMFWGGGGRGNLIFD